MLAEIVINRPSKHLDRTFTYHIPEGMTLGVGWRVVVPFAHRTEEGIVLSVREDEKTNFKICDIAAPVDEYPWFSPEMLELARWISLYYMCTYIEALRLFLIDKKGIRVARTYTIRWERIPETHLLRGLIDSNISELTEEDAKLILGDGLKSYVSSGYLLGNETPEAVYRPPLEKIYSAGILPEDETRKPTPKQSALFTFLSEHGPASAAVVASHGFSSAIVKKCTELGLVSVSYHERAPYSLIDGTGAETERTLTEEQAAAFAKIKEAIDAGEPRGQLLFGVTGSGKTEVYLRAAEYVRSLGGSVLILVPEIALTAQMTDYFSARFGDDVVFIHSKLSKGERYNNRTRIRTGASRIVIGSRSALFMPFPDLRLIIVDEEYDSSYKQDETPHYNARDAAKKLAVLCRCPIVMGAATPSLSTYTAAKNGAIDLLEMKHRVKETPLPNVTVVDMKDEVSAGNETLYSRELLSEMRKTTAEGKKTILFLNRRGYATTLRCKDCGHVFKCPNCDVSLVYHKDRHCLTCHYCESVFRVPTECPECKGRNIAYLGHGTERATEQLTDVLPEISVGRLDLDTTSRKHGARDILNDFRRGKFPVLLGTQMVAKGHDIPGVHLVGILNADSLCNMPTYLAGEQAFTLITQCAGRAGREEERGEVILQTYEPEHYIIRAAVRGDYEEFYEKEMEYRRNLWYPPYTRLMKITAFSENYETARKKAKQISDWLMRIVSEKKIPIRMTPPYDEAIKKIRNTYFVSIMVKGETLAPLKAEMRKEPLFRQNGILTDVDPLG